MSEPLKNNTSNTSFGSWGWIFIIVGFLLMGVIFGTGITLTGFIVAPAAEELGVSRGDITMMYTLSGIANIVSLTFVGKLFEKYNLRKVMSISLFITGLTYIGSQFVTSVSQLYVLGVIRGLISGTTSVIPVGIVTNNWFGPKVRGRAMGFVTLGTGTCAMILNPICAQLVANHGWRSVHLLFGGLSFFMIPIIMLFYFTRPEEKGLTMIGAVENIQPSQLAFNGLTEKEAMHSPAFWIGLLAISFAGVVGVVWNFNNSSFLVGLGLQATQVGLMLSSYSIAMMVGKVVLGILVDKKGLKFVMVLGIFSRVLAFICALLVPYNIAFVWGLIAFLGIGIADSTLVNPLIVSEMFGYKEYGKIYSRFTQLSNLVNVFTPTLMTMLSDASGYTAMWLACIGFCALSLILIMITFAKKPTEMKLEPVTEN